MTSIFCSFPHKVRTVESMDDDVSVVDKIVTKFIFNTCRLCPRLSKLALDAAICSWDVTTMHPDDDDNVDFVALITGSVAEFYIEPLLQHAGDIDIMFHRNNVLAIPRGYPLPTQLPAEFNNYVEIHEIIDSRWFGYVYLELRYLLKKCMDSDRYDTYYTYKKHGLYLSMGPTRKDMKMHGPAVLQRSNYKQWLSLDCVHCVRCLSWPSQAADWPTRHRNYDWPDSATVECVVTNGCDVVQVAHYQCKQYERENSRHQWRLSFSRAEIVLINSWMPVQQIVYHMLRVLMKTEQLTETADVSTVRTLSNYHIKTLTLWACELKPRSWWTDDLSLIRICVELLHTLAVWLTEARFPHYFINNCNLVDSSFALEMIARRLFSIDKECFTSWLISTYIRQSARICPDSISRLFDDVSTRRKLENALSAVVDWRLSTTTWDFYSAFSFAEYVITSSPSHLSVNARSCVCLMKELSKLDVRLSIYVAAVIFLHVAHKIGSDGLSENST